jgi:hypothetical protein
MAKHTSTSFSRMNREDDYYEHYGIAPELRRTPMLRDHRNVNATKSLQLSSAPGSAAPPATIPRQFRRPRSRSTASVSSFNDSENDSFFGMFGEMTDLGAPPGSDSNEDDSSDVASSYNNCCCKQAHRRQDIFDSFTDTERCIFCSPWEGDKKAIMNSQLISSPPSAAESDDDRSSQLIVESIYSDMYYKTAEEKEEVPHYIASISEQQQIALPRAPSRKNNNLTRHEQSHITVANTNFDRLVQKSAKFANSHPL